MIQNFQLAAWARGIGMIWRTNDWIYDPIFREAIGVESGEKNYWNVNDWVCGFRTRSERAYKH